MHMVSKTKNTQRKEDIMYLWVTILGLNLNWKKNSWVDYIEENILRNGKEKTPLKSWQDKTNEDMKPRRNNILVSRGQLFKTCMVNPKIENEFKNVSSGVMSRSIAILDVSEQ